jgi:hypothetical protein
MYLIYVDESGTKDPETTLTRADGTTSEKDWLYVLVGVALLELNWFKFEYALNRAKLDLLQSIYRVHNIALELADTEIKSRWIRIPQQRQQHPFLSHLTANQIDQLVDLYYQQLPYHRMRVFAVVIDKRFLRAFTTEEILHRKAYELLIERVEWFMKKEHSRHRAMMVVDNTSRQMNRSLAMKHSYFQREGTSSGSRIGHIIELPMFVESNLSNGVQLADLCAYNVYRAFKTRDIAYPYFARIEPQLYKARDRYGVDLEGLKVFPDDSPLGDLAGELARRRRNSNKQGK